MCFDRKCLVVLFQVQASLSELNRKLEDPVKSCRSSADTYQSLQNHMVNAVLHFAHFLKETCT